jgi:hypothetical protein
MKYQRQIGMFNVVAFCAEDLREQAEALLDKLSELNSKGSGLKDGTTIEFGWSLLTLKGDEDELVVCEPYFSNDPFQDCLPLVDDTLRVMAEQVALLNTIGVEGVTISFRDKVVILKECLEKERLYLERQQTKVVYDSGWYIGDPEEMDSQKTIDDLEPIYVYQLLNLRRSLMPLLILPPGYLAIINGTLIEAIFNQDNQNVWHGNQS